MLVQEIAGDANSIPGLGRSQEGGHRNLHRYSCLENPMDMSMYDKNHYNIVK